MADLEPFTLIEESSRPGPHHLFDDVVSLTSAKTADHDLQYTVALRYANPGMIVTGIPQNNVPLRAFSAAGFATCELDTVTDSFSSWRGFSGPSLRQNKGTLTESVFFAKYHYKWKGEDFILYTVGPVQYVLKERRETEHTFGPSKATDALIQAVGDWLLSDQEVVWVFDGFWQRSKALWEQVQKSNWDKVILDENMKAELTSVANTFFSSKDVYEDLGVPWKRGVMFYGPPGNGKTVSIKALMHTLLNRKDPIPTLYVKSAPNTFAIRQVFNQARALSPCMLILEDVETIVTPSTRSYFFERLDPGLTKRPSRFDRKYLFPLPNEHERTLYCEYWRHKLQNNPAIEFPKKLSPAMSRITPGFSFAFLQECFVATLLRLARDDTGATSGDVDDDDLDDYRLWVAFKEQADILRKEVDQETTTRSAEVASAEMEQCGHTGPTIDPSIFHHQCTELASTLGCGTPRRPSPSLVEGKQRLCEESRVLPELPLLYRKRNFINTAAYDYRVM